MHRLPAIVIAGLATCGFLTSQTTWYVDPGGGGHFVDIPPAIAAASPGDRIVVAAGSYSAVVLDKGVDIDGTAGALVPSITVTGVPVGQRARVARLEIAMASPLQVSIENCAGQVLLVDLVTPGLPSNYGGIGGNGVQIAQCASVWLEGGVFLGQSSGSIGGHGASVVQSNVVLSHAVFRGGVTAPPYPSAANDGRDGVYVAAGEVLLAAVDARGGNASDGPIYGGDGGNGVRADAASDVLAVGACHLVGKPGGVSWGGGPAGTDGHAAVGSVRVTADATLVGGLADGAQLIAARPRTSAPATAPPGSTWSVDVTGTAGQPVILFADLEFGYTPLPSLIDGPFVLGGIDKAWTWLFLSPAGTGIWRLPIPNHPATQHHDLFVQGFADLFSAGVATGPVYART